jgi:glycosyltransferase involved in cell wall biosynthesis
MAGGIPEVLEPADGSRAGLLVRPGSVEELEAAIRVLSADPTLRVSLGDAAHDRAVSEYSLEKMIARTVAVYRIALARTGKTR